MDDAEKMTANRGGGAAASDRTGASPAGPRHVAGVDALTWGAASAGNDGEAGVVGSEMSRADGVGGLDGLERWLEERGRDASTPVGRGMGLPTLPGRSGKLAPLAPLGPSPGLGPLGPSPLAPLGSFSGGTVQVRGPAGRDEPDLTALYMQMAAAREHENGDARGGGDGSAAPGSPLRPLMTPLPPPPALARRILSTETPQGHRLTTPSHKPLVPLPPSRQASDGEFLRTAGVRGNAIQRKAPIPLQAPPMDSSFGGRNDGRNDQPALIPSITAHEVQKIKSMSRSHSGSTILPLDAASDAMALTDGDKIYDRGHEQDNIPHGMSHALDGRDLALAHRQEPRTTHGKRDIGALAFLEDAIESSVEDDGGQSDGLGNEGGGNALSLVPGLAGPPALTPMSTRPTHPDTKASSDTAQTTSDMLLAAALMSPSDDATGGPLEIDSERNRALALIPEKRSDSGDGLEAYSAEEIMAHGRQLGIDPVFEPDLLWIAEQALGAPLPQHWTKHVTPAGDVYFANRLTGVTSWDHPLEDEFRALAQSVRQRKRQQAVSGTKGVDSRLTREEEEEEDEEEGTEYEDDSEFGSSMGTSLGNSLGTSLGTSFGTSMGRSQSFRRGMGGSVGHMYADAREKLPSTGTVGFVGDPRLAGSSKGHYQ